LFFIVQYVIDGRISRIAGLHLDFRQICTPGDDTRPDGRHRLRYANGGEGGTIGKRIVANRNYGIGYGDRSQSPAILECISLYLGYGIGQVYGC